MYKGHNNLNWTSVCLAYRRFTTRAVWLALFSSLDFPYAGDVTDTAQRSFFGASTIESQIRENCADNMKADVTFCSGGNLCTCLVISRNGERIFGDLYLFKWSVNRFGVRFPAWAWRREIKAESGRLGNSATCGVMWWAGVPSRAYSLGISFPVFLA